MLETNSLIEITRTKLLKYLESVSQTQFSLSTSYFEGNSDFPDYFNFNLKNKPSNSKGFLIIQNSYIKILIIPPFPIIENEYLPTFDLDQLNQILRKNRQIGIVLLRLGSYVLGRVQYGKIISSKSGTRYVKSRHKAGGQSQRRFERNREKWIESLYKQVCSQFKSKIDPYYQEIDYLIFGGDKIVINNFKKSCQSVDKFYKKLLGKNLNYRNPNINALKSASNKIWNSQIILKSNK